MAMNALKYTTLTAVSFIALSFSISLTKAYMKDAPELPDAAVSINGESGKQTAVFAGGCFWCTEVVFEHVKGVTDVVSGYSGGSKESAKYDLVSGGGTQHAEAIQIKYDASQISYTQLLKIFLSVAHDPTQLNRQGPDYGAQYRSEIFYLTPEQKRVTEAYLRQLSEAKSFDKPIVTKLSSLTAFYPAEQYHQDFVKRNPNHPYVVVNARPKLKKLQERFPTLVKSPKS
jgi:peptide-methionine (S)-S-oxide reductase